jgi:serine/threonine-protein kinase
MSASSAQHTPLRGNLAVTSVPDVLQMLEAQGCEGRVHFETEIGHADVEYWGGTIVSARLAELEGKSALFRLLGIVDGSFEVTYEPIEPRPALVANIARLVEDRSQRFSEWHKLSERAPSPWTVLRLTEAGGAELARGALGADESRVLGLVDGRRSMTDIIGESPFDAVEVLTMLVKAVERGAIATAPSAEDPANTAQRSRPPAPSPAVPPRGVLESVSLRKRTAIGLGDLDAIARATLEPVARGSEPPATGGVGSLEPAGRGTTEIRRIISIGAPSAESRGSSADRRPSQPPQESGEVPSARAREQLLNAELAPKRGRFVGRYELLCPIGRGGMGSVYLGRLSSEGGFRRLFAVKLLRRHLLEDSAAAQRFLEEARLAGHIHHPNVVSVTDAGFYGSQPYLVMDYIEGASFKQLLSSHPHARPAERILPIVLDALAGLHAAHTLLDDDGAPIGIVHCDVSPENLLVGVDGVCRLLDFGVAKSATYQNRERETVTRGKPGYLAPEQILGARVDRRADVFAMGVVLYNALTGVRLFEAPTAEETMQEVCVRRIEPPSTVGLRPPPALDFVCMRALDREPDRRYSSAEEMMTELRRIALREGLLASSVDIASWVRESVGRELAHRRLLVLEASRPQPRQAAPTQVVNVVPEHQAGSVALGRGRPSQSPPEPQAQHSGTLSLPTSADTKRAALIAASVLAALAVLVTLLWPNLISRMFRLETERVVAPPAAPAPPESQPSTGTDLADTPKP